MNLTEERPSAAAAAATTKPIGPKRKRVLDAVNHRVPDRVPMDFGGSAVTGIHVSCVAKLRDHYGLEKRLVKVHEPYQMLGLVEDDLKEAMGVDVTPLPSRTNMFGFQNRDWRPWTFNGLEVLVPAGFRVTTDFNGDTLIYPKGDVSARPSGRMPNGGFFFDSIIRQKPLDFDHLDPNDNTEQYQPLSEAELDGIEEDARAVDDGRHAVFASLVNTALGDIAFVPGPDLVDPKGVRDVAEWYMLTASHPEVVHKIFERQVEVGIYGDGCIFSLFVGVIARSQTGATKKQSCTCHRKNLGPRPAAVGEASWRIFVICGWSFRMRNGRGAGPGGRTPYPPGEGHMLSASTLFSRTKGEHIFHGVCRQVGAFGRLPPERSQTSVCGAPRSASVIVCYRLLSVCYSPVMDLLAACFPGGPFLELEP